MANRRFEMYEYRQVLLRLRLGGTDREVARAQRIGRAKVAHIRQLAGAQGWLEPSGPMPDDTQLATLFKVARTAAPNVSSVEPFRDEILGWHAQGIQVTTIRQALARIHGFAGSVHSVYRFLQQAAPVTPAATVMLDFAVADTAQVDFGQGPVITDRATGEVIKTWIFVMTLAWSRHQYAEIVRNQKVETWLACHRRAFEWFNGVPKKITIDNPKCAITRACYYEPEVQRSYGECALGYGFIIAPCPPRDPQKKGRVEAGVKYVKNNFVPLRDFHGSWAKPATASTAARARSLWPCSAPPSSRCCSHCRRSRRRARCGPKLSCMATATFSSSTATTRRRFAGCSTRSGSRSDRVRCASITTMNWWLFTPGCSSRVTVLRCRTTCRRMRKRISCAIRSGAWHKPRRSARLAKP